MEERAIDDEYENPKCNICGGKAAFIVQLEVVGGTKRYNAFRGRHAPFYLCKGHEHIHKKMKRSIT
ncbi:MAG TPA: hypothetical protein VNI77_11875 [Nitrososphaera sp.]|nr:hypothetical protein [Nitrososphaera sp.]